jgi:hypothetical protein
MNKSLRTAVILAAAAVLPAVALADHHATTKPATQPGAAAEAGQGEMTVASIINRHIEATGGREAYQALESMATTATLSFQGMEGKIDSQVRLEPLGMYMLMELPGVERQVTGFDGEVMWSTSMMQGNRVIEGEEKAILLRDADPRSLLNFEETYPQSKVVGETEIDGTKVVEIELTDAEGKKVNQFYDLETGLLVRASQIAPSPMGDLPVTTDYSDYKAFGDLKMATKSVQSMMGQQITLITDDVKVNAEVDAEKFAPPAEVKQLMPEAEAAE